MKAFNVIFKFFKGFRAEIVLKTAGVLFGDIFINADPHKPVGKNSMPFINTFRSRFSLICKGYIAVLIDFDKPAAF